MNISQTYKIHIQTLLSASKHHKCTFGDHVSFNTYSHTLWLVDALYLQTILPAQTSREEGEEMKDDKMVTFPKENHRTKIPDQYIQQIYKNAIYIQV